MRKKLVYDITCVYDMGNIISKRNFIYLCVRNFKLRKIAVAHSIDLITANISSVIKKTND